jgi:hypothetical protein
MTKEAKDHGSFIPHTNLTTIARAKLPSIGHERDFSTCLWPATAFSAGRLPRRGPRCGSAAPAAVRSPALGGYVEIRDLNLPDAMTLAFGKSHSREWRHGSCQGLPR